jgi:bacillithiol synthase
VRDLQRAYLAGEAAAFYASRPADPEARRQATLRPRPLAAELHRILCAQNASLPASPARDRNLAALAAGAAAVVTGQQVGLFLGPLYAIHKAASAIAWARRLSAESGRAVVPVFWLQTEDHDLVEIASVGLPGRSLAVPASVENRVSIAHLTLPAEVEPALAQAAETLGSGSHTLAHLERLGRHYCSGAPWGRAFAGVMAELFAEEGLVFLDPRDLALAPLAWPVHERALRDAAPIAAALSRRSEELTAAGFEPPVHVRADAPLSFVHDGSPEGPRRRATAADLGLDPRLYSTSALLRPILQDTLLPTAGYVGGPTEVAYFAQLAPLYAAYGMTMPLVIPRGKFRVVDGRARKLLDRLGLTLADVAKPEAELLSRLCPPSARATHLLDTFRTQHAALTEAVAATDPAVVRALSRTEKSVARALGKLDARLIRTAAYRDAERVAALRRLQALVPPAQERLLGLLALVPAIGDRELVERILAAVECDDPALKDVAA